MTCEFHNLHSESSIFLHQCLYTCLRTGTKLTTRKASFSHSQGNSVDAWGGGGIRWDSLVG